MRKTEGIQVQVSEVTKQLEVIRQHTNELAQQAAALEAQLKLARGTRDVRKEAADADGIAQTTAAVEAMIRERPLGHREIMERLPPGTNENRVKGILTKMRKDIPSMVNLGSDARGLWFIPDGKILQRLRRTNPLD